MVKTTVYLPDDLHQAIKQVALARGIPEAEVIRQSLRASISEQRPRPRGGLFASGDPIADRVDELLTGFGER
jgi:metal-responsive CopG/Arc/MetJ family transcriptional regulator